MSTGKDKIREMADQIWLCANSKGYGDTHPYKRLSKTILDELDRMEAARKVLTDEKIKQAHDALTRLHELAIECNCEEESGVTCGPCRDVDIIEQVLSELEGSKPKELTDEEIERISYDRYLKRYYNGDREWQQRLADAMSDGLRHARDNGYLAPAADNNEPHVHTVYEAIEGGYICSGCEMRFIRAVVTHEDLYAVVLINALRLSSDQWTSLIRDLLDKGAKLPVKEQMTTDAGRGSLPKGT